MQKSKEYCVLIIMLLTLFSINSIFAQQGVYKEKNEMSFLFSGSVIHKKAKGKIKTNNRNFKIGPCNIQEVNRRIDGSCNNILTNNTNWGSAGQPLLRIMPDAYNQNGDLVGQNRKNPREISKIVCQMNGEAPSATLSSFVFTWGQFLDHDITATPTGDEAAPIPVIPNDAIIEPIAFNRSLPLDSTGINGIPREQFNEITSWIDASNVYGSDIEHANDLRTFTNGKLKVSSDANGEDILPMINGNFTAGDERALEQPGLTSLHILFVREHNRICDELMRCGMTDDEAIYQKARKQIGALMQTITYNEFLPALGVQLLPYRGYDDNLQPDISNVFATAGFRLGHTMVTDNVVQFDDNGNQINSLSLAQAFFNASLTQTNGIEGFLNGLAQQFQEEIDAQIVESLRSFLFAPSPVGPGLDLAALNIQRGRDHGLYDYNSFRDEFGIRPATNFSDITSNITLQNKLATAYNNDVDNIDVWVGLLSEDHLSGSSIGPTLHAILEDQFAALRDGDFYFFENDPGLTATEKQIIRNTRLSDVIKRNTNIQNIKADVFYGPCNSNNFNQAACIADRGDCGCEVWEVCDNGSCILNYDIAICDNASTCPDGTEVTITIKLDNYPAETDWTIKNAAGSSVAFGGNYNEQQKGSTILEDLCLKDGCYTFIINDLYEDGICCAYGNGSYTVTFDNNKLASSGEFGKSGTTNFCFGDTNNGTSDNNRLIVDGTYLIQSKVNGEKAIAPGWDNFNVRKHSPETIYPDQQWVFEHIGAGKHTIRNFGTDKYLEVFAGQCKNGSNINSYVVADSDHHRWYIELIDNDYFLLPVHCTSHAMDRNINSEENIHLWTFNTSNKNQKWNLVPQFGSANPGFRFAVSEREVGDITVSPNPAKNNLKIDLSNYTDKSVHYFITSITGQILLQGDYEQNHGTYENINLTDIPNGSYIFHLQSNDNMKIAKKFIVSR